MLFRSTSQVASCSLFPLLRALHVAFLVRSCSAYRPDDGEQGIPKGFTFHAEGMLNNNGLEIDRLLLQRRHAEQDDQSRRQLPSSANITRQLAGTATHLHIKVPSAFQQLGMDMSGPNQKEVVFCKGEQSQWACKDGDEVQSRIPAGSTCKVVCNDAYNFKAKKEEVKCIEQNGVGFFELVPECEEVEHCDNPGDGWKCTDSYLTGTAERPVVGKTCTPKCEGELFRSSVQTATCMAGKRYDKEIKCIQLAECLAAGNGWECENTNGGKDQIKHGKQCAVSCKGGGKLVPVHPTVTCNGMDVEEGQRGFYTEGFPACLPEKEAQAARKKHAQDHAAKDQDASAAKDQVAKKASEGEEHEEVGPTKSGAHVSILSRYTASIGLLLGMLNCLVFSGVSF